MFSDDLFVPVNQPWGDKVKGSWWKAILLIVAYFLLRIKLESMILVQGIKMSGQEASISDLQDPIKVMTWLGQAQWYYQAATLLLLVFIFIGLHVLTFKLFDLKEIKGKLLAWTVLVFCTFFILNIGLSLLITYFQPDYLSPDNQQAVEALVGQMASLGAFVNIVILTPITEEILFRGLIMKYTFPLIPALGALVASLVFTYLHGPANLIDFMIYFILSAGITFVYWKTRKIEYAIFYHMIQNLLAFIQISVM